MVIWCNAALFLFFLFHFLFISSILSPLQAYATIQDELCHTVQRQYLGGSSPRRLFASPIRITNFEYVGARAQRARAFAASTESVISTWLTSVDRNGNQAVIRLNPLNGEFLIANTRGEAVYFSESLPESIRRPEQFQVGQRAIDLAEILSANIDGSYLSYEQQNLAGTPVLTIGARLRESIDGFHTGNGGLRSHFIKHTFLADTRRSFIYELASSEERLITYLREEIDLTSSLAQSSPLSRDFFQRLREIRNDLNTYRSPDQTNQQLRVLVQTMEQRYNQEAISLAQSDAPFIITIRPHHFIREVRSSDWIYTTHRFDVTTGRVVILNEAVTPVRILSYLPNLDFSTRLSELLNRNGLNSD